MHKQGKNNLWYQGAKTNKKIFCFIQFETLINFIKLKCESTSYNDQLFSNFSMIIEHHKTIARAIY